MAAGGGGQLRWRQSDMWLLEVGASCGWRQSDMWLLEVGASCGWMWTEAESVGQA